jgi:two-component system sensor histidine kinase KdpD
MPRNGRPNPYDLLRELKEEEPTLPEKKSRLTIFLGYAAGVGKTYTMLQRARLAKGQQVDIVVGLAETHGRVETEALLEGLEIIPRRQIEYGGLVLEEMDLDAILTRRPQVVLVDELAHTNAPGSRHAKRYQDVEELLNAGISVFTTLNVQHIEGANDVVFQISGIRVQETVPDSILERADDLALVDLPPDELLKRFREGKVYVPAKAEQAIRRFFQTGNLMALRELALRVTARRVEDEMVSYMKEHAIKGPWSSGSRLMVCVGHNPASQRMIRLAHQMAQDLGAEWYAVHVESPYQHPLSDSAWEQLSSNLRLAEELGGKEVLLVGAPLVQELLDFARANNVTLIFLGASKRPWWKLVGRGTLVDELIRIRGPINILVGGAQEGESRLGSRLRLWRKADWLASLWSLLVVAAATLLCLPLRGHHEFVNFVMIQLLAVVVCGAVWGKRAGFLASLLAVASLDFFFAKPFYTFAVADVRFLPTFFVFVGVALAMSWLADLVRRQGQNAKQREQFVTALYEFSRNMMEACKRDEVLSRATATIARAFECEVTVLLPDERGELCVQAQSDRAIPFDGKEIAVSTWAFRNKQSAGRGTETLTSSVWFHLPLLTHAEVYGVLAVRVTDPEKWEEFKSPDRRKLLESFASVVALALFRLK